MAVWQYSGRQHSAAKASRQRAKDFPSDLFMCGPLESAARIGVGVGVGPRFPLELT